MMDDTTPEAKRHYYSVLRKMTRQQRAEQMCSMSIFVKELSMAGIRRRHPDYDDEQMRFAYLRIIMGKEQFTKAFPQVSIHP